jgi:hypothetical protein
MRKLSIFLLSSALACFQAIDFPGEQAEIESDDVNDFNAANVDEAIFDEIVDQQVDVDGDDINDFGFSMFLTIGANQDAALLCDEAQAADSIEDLANAFDDVLIAGSFILKVEDLNAANGFEAGEEINADPAAGFFVFSFFAATQAGNLEALAESFGDLGNFEFDLLSNVEFSGIFDDTMEFENSDGDVDFANPNLVQEINLDADINGLFFNATACDDLDAIVEELLLRRFGIIL